MNKREMIERAMGPFTDLAACYLGGEGAMIDALAEQAIVIECEVEHGCTAPYKEYTKTFIKPIDSVWNLMLDGVHGTPGKALAIIIPLKEE